MGDCRAIGALSKSNRPCPAKPPLGQKYYTADSATEVTKATENAFPDAPL